MNSDKMNDMKPESQYRHLMEMTRSTGWKILLFYLGLEMENIIKEGIESRAAEKGTRTWAELKGFRRAAEKAERLIKTMEPKETSVENPIGD